MDNYELLAHALDSLPNGFPSTGDGSELRLLQKLFTPEEAGIASQLRPTPESVEEIAARTGLDPSQLRLQLKSMAKRGLITIDRGESAMNYCLMPFVVGIYEMQVASIDKELALLVEDYFQKAFTQVLTIRPQYHRVIPVGETVRNNMEVHPYENAADLINSAQSWGVLDCICRKQKALVGEPCHHPVDVCMALNEKPGAFDNNPVIHALTHDQALATLKRAADAGLVHSVSNNQQGLHYICNCCTCSCGILRSMANLGVANVIARSAFINTVDESLCTGCEICVSYCQFDALTMEDVVKVNAVSCVGCGVCVPACSSEALILVRRPESEILPVPETLADWKDQRAAVRGLSH